MASIGSWLNERRIVVVVGPGGVGKTTTSAALALEAARRGRHVLVLTVDPARRLMDSLGLSGSPGEAKRVSPAAFAEARIALGAGSLTAMMLDVQQTFDGVIERHAPTEALRRRIMDSRFYHEASTSLAGSHEYMAMEALYELDRLDEYELIILDTPPTTHALDFISAPERLAAFLEGGSFRFMLSGMAKASRLGLGLLRFDNAIVTAMNRFVGAETFLELVDFVDAFQEMYSGFNTRARKVTTMLREPQTAFIIVTSTRSVAMKEGLFLHEKLRATGLRVDAVVANRVVSPSPDALDPEVMERALSALDVEATLAAGVAQGAARANERARRNAEVDARRLGSMERALAPLGPPLISVPRFERDIHDLASLAAFATLVTGG